MQSYNEFDEHFDTEPEQKRSPYIVVHDEKMATMMLSFPTLTSLARKPGSGQAKTDRVKLERVKPEPKQAAQAPRALTRAEFAVEHRLAAASEKSFDPENPNSPRVQTLALTEANVELTQTLRGVEQKFMQYKAAIMPRLAQYEEDVARIEPLKAELVKTKDMFEKLSYQVRRLTPFELEVIAEKARYAELVKERDDDNVTILGLQLKVDTIVPLTQELDAAKARIVELEAGVDPELERLKQETLRLEAALTESTKTQQELDAAKLEIRDTETLRDELHAKINVLRQHLADIRVGVKADLVDTSKTFKIKMEILDAKLDAWVPPA